MFYRFILFFIFILKCNASLSEYYKVPDVDFMRSLTDGNRIAKQLVSLTPKNIEIYKNNYEAKRPSKMHYHINPLIPKVMHHIWDGDIPPLYQNYLNECKKLHPDWEFKFWSDKDIDDLVLEYGDVYYKARSYAGRADIARYEILYRFGGVYRDMDVKCFRPIDDLSHKYEFFAPIEAPIEAFKKQLFKTEPAYDLIPLNNGVIGAKAGNPILKTTLNIIRENFDKLLHEFDHSPEAYVHGISSTHSFAVKSTMYPLTEGFVQNASLSDKNIALPPTYFFSLLNRKYKEPRSLEGKINKLFYRDSIPPAFHFLEPESLMLHNSKPEKREILTCRFHYGSTMSNTRLSKLIKTLEPKQLKAFRVFESLYAKNFPPNNLVFYKKSKVPQTLHFVVFNRNELSKLEQILPLWKLLNWDFEFQIWDKARISEVFNDASFVNISENLRFYLGLRIIEKFGGTYANYKAKPHQSIFELNNRYALYAGLKPLLEENQNLSLSQKLIGARKEHQIISAALKQIDPKDPKSIDTIDKILLSETYKGIFLWGKNIVLPAIYFEPIAKISEESFKDKFKRMRKSLPRPFSIYTEFTVIE